MFNKFKLLLEDDSFFYGVCIILVGCACFGLGRLSIAETQGILTPNEASVVLTQPAEVQQTELNASTSAPVYVGSRNGTKFHLLSCPGASQIKEENKVFFASVEEAHMKGYTKAGNCPGI